MSHRLSNARLASGLRIHYAEHGYPDGTPVLFLHGWPDSWFTFSRVLPLLSHSIRAVVPDQRGFGNSDRPDENYSIEQLADDAAALLDAIGIGHAAIVGHSFGSFVSRRVAIAHPDRVSRLVLIDSAPTAANATLNEVEAVVRKLSDPVSPAFAHEFQAGTAYLPLPESFFNQIVAESLKMPARVWRATFNGLLAYNDDELRSSISAPTLLLWGDHDALFSRENQDQLLASIPGATLKVYADTGHCPNWERPEAVTADIQAFVLGQR